MSDELRAKLRPLRCRYAVVKNNLVKYALKNAAIPLVTIIGLEFGILLGGAVITEAVFAALFGWIFLHETLLPIQMAGCALIIGAVILVQMKGGKIKT